MRKNLTKQPDLKRIMKGIYLPENNWHVLNKYAGKIERSTNWVLSKIIDEWILKNKKILKA